MTAFTETEQEVIILNAVWGMIDDMVNYEVFAKNEKTEDITLLPNTPTHQRLFNILLVDFLSSPEPRKGSLPFNLPQPPHDLADQDRTFLFFLRRVCCDPRLGSEPNLLSGPIDDFSDWLGSEALIEKVWLPSIELELDIRVRRIEFLKICGNIAKHNFGRLERTVHKICRILRDNGQNVDERHGYAMLPEFYEWFHEHLFNYHVTRIAEFLNNIRWGIFEYLRPEFARCFERDDLGYRFHPPADITNPLAEAMYWELMNRARSEPWFPRFTTSEWLKLRY